MALLPLDQIITAWVDSRAQALPEALILEHTIMRALADGRPVSAQHVAAVTGLPLDRVHEPLERLLACGAETDEAGNVTGWILSLHPTPHRLYVNGRTLYAWCALDTLFLPALIGQAAEVESICPATGISIQLTITPTGVTAVQPSSTALSIVVPGVSSVCKTCQDGEIARTVCYAMHFFSARDVAAQWLSPHSDVAVLTLEEAWQLVHAVWIEPMAKILMLKS